MRISDGSSDVCSSDLCRARFDREAAAQLEGAGRTLDEDRRLAEGATHLVPDDDAAHSRRDDEVDRVPQLARQLGGERRGEAAGAVAVHQDACALQVIFAVTRSEEHTSELQSLMRISYAVFCLKKKKTTQ